MAVTNTLAYSGATRITNIKTYIVQALSLSKFIFSTNTFLYFLSKLTGFQILQFELRIELNLRKTTEEIFNGKVKLFVVLKNIIEGSFKMVNRTILFNITIKIFILF